MGWQVQPPPTQLGVLQSLGVPSTVVQAATPASGTSPVSVSFAHNITAGNSVIVTFVSTSATSGAVTPASGPDSYTLDVNVGLTGASGHGQFFHVSHSAGGYSSVTATLAAASLEVYAYEVIGTCTFDTSAVNGSATPSFSTNFTPGASAEFLAALATNFTAATLTTPPAAPWVNGTVLSLGPTVGSYQFVSSVATVTYSGTWSAGTNTGAAVAGYKLTNPTGTVPVGQCVLYYVGGSLYALGTSGVPVLLATT